jgi:hypothetical protein
MTVYVVDAHTNVQGLVLVVKMVTVLEECPIEEQRSVMHFYGQKTQCKGYSQINVSCLRWELFVA